ncbi:MAG: hypothetical protein M1818_001766 [Claussenomyces sp. TS43310]|nr:MAG: hypothetical protein M1818_001766 [Claussenomyces sp. TS43310]
MLELGCASDSAQRSQHRLDASAPRWNNNSLAQYAFTDGHHGRHARAIVGQTYQSDVTIPIHYDDYDDYDVFLSLLEDFKKALAEAGLANKVLYLDRKDQYRFKVNSGL